VAEGKTKIHGKMKKNDEKEKQDKTYRIHFEQDSDRAEEDNAKRAKMKMRRTNRRKEKNKPAATMMRWKEKEDKLRN
jgi:hypothetical protein